MPLFELLCGLGKNYEVTFLNFRSLVTVSGWVFCLDHVVFLENSEKKNLKKNSPSLKNSEHPAPSIFSALIFDLQLILLLETSLGHATNFSVTCPV